MGVLFFLYSFLKIFSEHPVVEPKKLVAIRIKSPVDVFIHTSMYEITSRLKVNYSTNHTLLLMRQRQCFFYGKKYGKKGHRLFKLKNLWVSCFSFIATARLHGCRSSCRVRQSILRHLANLYQGSGYPY